MSLTPDKLKALFEDLGKPTMRGVRKCPKCGTLNGTRGISCKNKDCDVVFKEREKKKGHSADAVKILTGSASQLFSVRLRDRGPDYRGFVQFPAVHDFEGNPAVLDSNMLAQTAHCYVDTCSRSQQQQQLGSTQQSCTHIRGALACEQEAEPLTLKNSVLNMLPVTSDTKQAIWLLATETTGPLVQRVTKNIMVVKCKTHSKQPLGFLHFSFFETSRNRAQPEHKFQCSCKAFKTMKQGTMKEDTQRRCVHFYACICAFSSDDQLAEEFMFYINLVHTAAATILSGQLITIVSQPDEQAIAALATTAETVDVTDEQTSVEVIIDEDGVLTASEPKRQRVDDIIGGTDTVAQASSALLTLQDTGSTSKKHSPVKQGLTKPAIANVKKTSTTTPLNELTVSLSFHQWLASVTERINQTMHYQFDGNPEPLVFHAPQGFFDCLQQRISAGNKKKRLPNSTTGFVRRDALPLGMFTKYTWNITNILHVKQIFDTAEMPLDITRSFVENHDGTFDNYEAPSVDGSETPLSKNQPPIRPFELKTYIKVGNTSADQKEPTPFIIEWIPNILPKSRIGELRIKFEYGHQRNGQIEHRTTTGNLEVQTIHIQ